MAHIQIVRQVDKSPDNPWSAVTHWPAHAQFVPLTRISVTNDGFNAFTGIGRFGFNDPMHIVESDPPRRCHLVKKGRVVRGWATLTVTPHRGGSQVVWTEEIRIVGVPAVADPIVAAASRWLFSRVIDGLLA